MLILAATTDKFSLISSSTAALDVHVSYVDINSSTGAWVGGGKQNAAIVTATTTDILASPAATTLRNAKTVNIRNKSVSSPNTVTVQFDQNGTLFELYKVTLQAGEALEYIEGVGWFVLGAIALGPEFVKVLSADDTGGQNVATAQPWFPTNGTITLPAATSYLFSGQLMLATGATTHTTGNLFGGTATLTSIDYHAQIFSTANLAIGTALSVIRVSVATNIVLNGTSTAVETVIRVSGIVRINAAGTFIPQFQFSANPTGTITVRRGSHFTMKAIGDNTVVNVGPWT